MYNEYNTKQKYNSALKTATQSPTESSNNKTHRAVHLSQMTTKRLAYKVLQISFQFQVQLTLLDIIYIVHIK